MDELNAPFEERYGVTVDAVAQGTGAALETARNGDSDVVMVHARSLEDEFMREGYGVNRRDIMFNDFVVVDVGDGVEIQSVVTAESVDRLGLEAGREVIAAFKSTAARAMASDI